MQYDHHPSHQLRQDPYYARSRDQDGYSSLNSDGYSYNPRYSYASPPHPSRIPTNRPQPEFRKKPRWPPSPSVEDESDSLAKEFPSATTLSDASSGEVHSRGLVDQEPIMLEVEQPKSNQNDERRFVLVSGHGTSAASSSTTRDGRRRSFVDRGNIPHLKTAIDDSPILSRREPSPYAYSKPAKAAGTRTSGEYFLSPEVITPLSSSVPRSFPSRNGWDGIKDQNSKPAKQKHERYDSVQSPRKSKVDLFDDSDVDVDESAKLRNRRKPSRYSFVKGDLQKEDLRTSLHDTAKEPRSTPRSSDSRQANESSNSLSPGASKASTPPPPQSPRSSSSHLYNVSLPQQIPAGRPHPVETPYARSPRKYQDVRPGSPLVGDCPWAVSPPRSPTLAPFNGVHSPPGSNPNSRPGSRTSSRPASPLSVVFTNPMPLQSPPRIGTTEVDWNSTYPPITNHRSRPISRHGRQETMPIPIAPRIDVQSPSPARPQTVLPYPVDDRDIETFMPSEESYQVHPLHPAIYERPISPAYPRSPTNVSSPSTTQSRENIQSSRPLLTSRHTATEEVPRLTRQRSNSVRSTSSYVDRRNDRKAAQFTLETPLPPCPRPDYTSKYDDWYTLENCRNFDVCPSCFDAVFANTRFAPYFQQARRQERSVRKNCDFSSPWVRLAWLLTVKQQRKSLDLIYALATIREIENPCPGSRKYPGTWYGILDQHGAHVTNFAICPCDLNQLEALLPSLRGYFTRIYPADPRQTFTCSVRTNSRRFSRYLDLLIEIDEKAARDRRTPDLRPFIELAKENAYKHECPRDNLVINQGWHFIPRLPEFTVCEECYDDVVWPAIKSGSKLANDFNRTIQFVPNEESLGGTSCQLYSPRMRRVWQRAIEDDDFVYLAKKATERKRVEIDLQRQHKSLLRLLEGRGEWRARQGGIGSMPEGIEREILKEQLADNVRQWKDWE
ncbi:hypothetical protein K432DRAFT_328209 [Lepidopterella palustris CBS 459.81]|uniref:Uncharacterized protein n=1 Tax=Lepidopterella palustris CBS 459.81 TaxID=1314670 RepID=A0A8E2JFG9_9PEZI|nr:hypothetical protein K432DRAFT_328209 [Lepidopterella palustris CBS 459.81]